MNKIEPRYIMIERLGADHVKVSELSEQDINSLPRLLQELPNVTNGLIWRRDFYTIETIRLLKQELDLIRL